MVFRLVVSFALASLASAQEKTTYDDHVFPIFEQACLNCHNPDKTKGGLDLSSFGLTLKGSSGGKVVEPGNPSSLLISSVQQTGEKKMPPEGDKLSNEQIEILKRWIEGGLLENNSSSARKPEKPRFETTLRSDPAAKPDGPLPMPQDLLLEPPVITSRPTSVHALACSPWAPLIAITGQRQVLLYHTETLELAGILPFDEGEPVSLNFTPDARYLIVGGGTAGKSGVTVTFDITTGSRLLTVAKEFDSVLAADIRPSFDIVATGGPSRLLKIWNTETGALIKSIKKHTDWITALDLSVDGVLLASGDRNGGVWVWESESASEFHTLRGHQSAITVAVFRADSNILATASEDGTVRFWEMNSGSEVKKLDAHSGGVTAFAFARDGSSITAGRDMKAKLWKPDFSHARDLVSNLPALPTAVALDPEGKRAFLSDAQGSVHVFETSDGKKVGEFQTNPPSIATRLQNLAIELNNQEQSTSSLNAVVKERSAARDAARQALADAEKTRGQAVQIHQAAKTGAEQTPGDGTHKIEADALARVQLTEQAILQLQAALASAEKATAEAIANTDSANLVLGNLNSKVKRWSAADINTKFLRSRREAAESTGDLDENCQTFTKATDDVTIQANNLNTRRSAREQLMRQLMKNDDSPEVALELRATLEAIDTRISMDADRLAEMESEMLARRQSVESIAPIAHQKLIHMATLQQDYANAAK
jgi:WD40 repeat protein